MLEVVTKDLVFTISLKRSTQNLQLSTSWAGRLHHLLSGTLTQVRSWSPITVFSLGTPGQGSARHMHRLASSCGARRWIVYASYTFTDRHSRTQFLIRYRNIRSKIGLDRCGKLRLTARMSPDWPCRRLRKISQRRLFVCERRQKTLASDTATGCPRHQAPGPWRASKSRSRDRRIEIKGERLRNCGSWACTYIGPAFADEETKVAARYASARPRQHSHHVLQKLNRDAKGKVAES